ncbi:Gag-Pol polyprotein [Colletotrichum aenigma]|uniref:Gag-Pol polyprotein n=1 Tax=Colletotrichum aenigma TaxID=1215731 RepID=UPI0018721EA4|nr:Gag-Pol polyprotein [Colletotrichum aenigma]KAF5512791.1 Gag-Pol polyprotein [Colletotrichum aenigma]
MIPIKQESDSNEAVLPWGPLYSMSREELLVLRKTLRDLLDKGFICASSSEASALAAPKTVKGVRSFLGFANYYWIFIPAYSEIAGPLISLIKKGVLFHWGKEQEVAFQELKRIFAAKPILYQLDPERTTYVEADCSGFALRGVLS